MALEWFEFTFIENKENLVRPLSPTVNWLEANIPIYYASQFNDFKLRNQGMNLCNQ